VEGGERQWRLGLDALRPYDERLTGTSHEILEQGRLPDTGLTADHHAAGRPVPCLLDEVGQDCLFAPPAD
jgi:hypothetical protein